MSHQTTLLTTKRFLPLFITQFLGAFNDNIFKNALVVLLTFNAAQWTNMSATTLANLAAGLFILPFFLFSALAGQLADRYDKSLLAQWTKILEIVIILLAGVGFYLGSLGWLFGALFLLGLQSTLFGPVKYAILPQHLHENELVGGNALIEAGTFVSILLGTMLGGILAGLGAQSHVWITTTALIVAVAGYVASCSIPTAPAPTVVGQAPLAINLNLFTETWRTIRLAQKNEAVFLPILGISWFWLFGALMLTQFPAYTQWHLHGNESAVTLMLTVFTLGIGLGSLLCERLSGERVELGLVPFGAIGITLFSADFFLASPESGEWALRATQGTFGAGALLAMPEVWRLLLDLLLIGAFGGFFIVPLYAMVQQRAIESERARTIAANNIMNALFMVVGSIFAGAVLEGGISIPALIGIAAVMNALVAYYLFKLLPEFLIRFVIWLLVHTIYRLKTEHISRIPENGGALLVCNHVSFVDALIISVETKRFIRFVMDYRIFRWPLLSFVFRVSRAIPIASMKENPVLCEEAISTAAKALAEGELVLIFPEGALTRDGAIGEFRRGYLRILEQAIALNPAVANLPIVPMALSGLWQSLLAKRPERGAKRLFHHAFFKKITLVVGEPLPVSITPETLRLEVLKWRQSP